MKAVLFHRYGTADELRLETVDKPVPKAGEVLVKIYAVSVNDWDLGLLTGTPFANKAMNGFSRPKKVKTIGSDIAGIIETVGTDVTRFKPGDGVFGDLCENGWGGFAEYVCAPEDALMPKPANLSFEEAAAVPQAGLLAWQGLHHDGLELKPGMEVLVNGASGGVGPFAIQLVQLADAKVTAVCSTEKIDFVRSLGVTDIIDYKKDDFTKLEKRYDIILDVKGFHGIFDYRRVLKSNGTYAMLGGKESSILQAIFLGPLLSRLGSKKMAMVFYHANQGLEDMTPLLDNGKIKAVIDRSYPLEESADAMRYYREGKAKGKVVITVCRDEKA